MIQREGGSGWELVSIKVCGEGLESWVKSFDVSWLLFREEFAGDTFVFYKKVEEKVKLYSVSVLFY